jgi:hypothetical protein
MRLIKSTTTFAANAPLHLHCNLHIIKEKYRFIYPTAMKKKKLKVGGALIFSCMLHSNIQI